MKMLIVGHDTGDETVVDLCAGEDTSAICDEWKRVRGDSFIMVATWDVDELQDTLNTMRRTTEARLIEDFNQMGLFNGDTTHLHEKADEADAYRRFVAATNHFKTQHELANPDRTEHTLAEWDQIDEDLKTEWRAEVGADETRLGFDEWLVHKREDEAQGLGDDHE